MSIETQHYFYIFYKDVNDLLVYIKGKKFIFKFSIIYIKNTTFIYFIKMLMIFFLFILKGDKSYSNLYKYQKRRRRAS